MPPFFLPLLLFEVKPPRSPPPSCKKAKLVVCVPRSKGVREGEERVRGGEGGEEGCRLSLG